MRERDKEEGERGRKRERERETPFVLPSRYSMRYACMKAPTKKTFTKSQELNKVRIEAEQRRLDNKKSETLKSLKSPIFSFRQKTESKIEPRRRFFDDDDDVDDRLSVGSLPLQKKPKNATSTNFQKFPLRATFVVTSLK